MQGACSKSFIAGLIHTLFTRSASTFPCRHVNTSRTLRPSSSTSCQVVKATVKTQPKKPAP